MKPTVRAKFFCSSIQKSAYVPGPETNRANQAKVELSPVPFDSRKPDSENSRFWQASPNGKLEMYITNPAAVDQFALGQEYYIDFTPVPAPEAAPTA